jgi:hypothetical protein
MSRTLKPREEDFDIDFLSLMRNKVTLVVVAI